jgi:hypothetical protein
MRVLVSDTSVLIDLERGQLLEATFALNWEFAVPDLLYKRELRDHNGPELLRLGLRIESLDGDGVHTALGYQARVPALSLADSFALALAKINNWTLLAGDGELRKLAAIEAVNYHGVLWVFDQLLAQQAVAAEMLHRSLTTIANHPRCRLPVREVRERLEHYARAIRGEA